MQKTKLICVLCKDASISYKDSKKSANVQMA